MEKKEAHPFSFELSESLYFESGQEVYDMLEIALDPEISIQNFGEYVSIHGVIALYGKYQLLQMAQTGGHLLEEEALHGKKFMEQVVNEGNAIASFHHRFPVEISVPVDRIRDMEEVTVEIDSFDYSLPSKSELHVESVILIDGIHEGGSETVQTSETPVTDESVPSEYTEKARNDMNIQSEKGMQEFDRNDQEESQEYKSHTTADEEEETHHSMVEQQPDETMTEYHAEDDYESSVPEEEQEDYDAKARMKNDNQEKSESLQSFLKHEKDVKDEPEADEESEYVPSEEDVKPENTIETYERKQEGDENDTTSFESLKSLFESEESDTYANMRICIVQEQDTMEKIAYRYDLSIRDIMMQNKLDDENVSAGQLLFIPESDLQA